MKTIPAKQSALTFCLLLAASVIAVSAAQPATNDLTAALQRGLFEEEVNQNLGAAIQAYQTVASQFYKDRKLAGTAVFRLGECYRRQGNTNDATTQYERILRDFSDQPILVTLSRQYLERLGSAPAALAAPAISNAARQEQKRLLEEEIKLVQKQLESQQKQLQVGTVNPEALWPTEREILKLKRQVAALDAGLPLSVTAAEAPATATSTDADEVKRIQALIKDSPDLINSAEGNGQTLLESAAKSGKLAVVKVLLDSGAVVDGLKQPGMTPLHWAAAYGHKAVVDLLLSKGAKADAQTENGVTPLHLAARKGYEAVAKALLASGAPVDAHETRAIQNNIPFVEAQISIGLGTTPLHFAANAGYIGMVKLLLAKGADVNAEDADGRTPLSYAAEKNSPAVVQLLQTAHANPNAGRLNLPLAEAAYDGDMPTLKLLLANGADPNTNAMFAQSVNTRIYQFPKGGKFTPLFLAVNKRHIEAAKELLRCKADPNITSPVPAPGLNSNPLLFEALLDAPTLKVLLEGGADPNVRTSGGTPMLLLAVDGENHTAVELLLAHHAEVNCTNKDGWTPLYAAAGKGNTAIAELLLKAGAAVNAKECNGYTPLAYAVARANLELAELLLTNKANPNERNNSGQTPLDLAKQPTPGTTLVAKDGTMADLLRRYGATDDLPRMDCIEVRRPSAKYWSTVFTKGTNNWNEFTLLELLGVKYDLLSAPPEAFPPRPGSGGSIHHFGMYSSMLPFPDLAHLHIRRPAPDMKTWQEQVVDISPLLLSGDCAKDLRLEWGDVVEILETDHPLNGRWDFFSKEQMANLQRCLTRQVEILINGQGKKLTLAPTTPQTQFCLKPVLLGSNLVLASSDLSRVKVTRRDPASGQTREWVVDCSQASPVAPDFWLRDGDKVEVPEKSH